MCLYAFYKFLILILVFLDQEILSEILIIVYILTSEYILSKFMDKWIKCDLFLKWNKTLISSLLNLIQFSLNRFGDLN